ncbi:MAG: hypothetical protein AAB666_02790 [Patescibacteria group bacterium]
MSIKCQKPLIQPAPLTIAETFFLLIVLVLSTLGSPLTSRHCGASDLPTSWIFQLSSSVSLRGVRHPPTGGTDDEAISLSTGLPRPHFVRARNDGNKTSKESRKISLFLVKKNGYLQPLMIAHFENFVKTDPQIWAY